MALASFHLGSDHALQRSVSVSAFLPETGKGPFPVLYLLHGLTDDHTSWMRQTRAEAFFSKWPLVVIMPDASRSFYVDGAHRKSEAFETFVARDLVAWVDRTFRTGMERKDRMTMGLSMGGYGAFRLAMRHPETFSAAVSFSGALGVRSAFEAGPEVRPFREELEPLWGPGDADALPRLAEAVPPELRPSLRFECGTEDPRIGEGRALRAHLDSLGWPSEYEEHPGAHDWPYWGRCLERSEPFLKRHFGFGA